MSNPAIAAMDPRVIHGLNREDLEDALMGRVPTKWITAESDDQLRERLIQFHNDDQETDL